MWYCPDKYKKDTPDINKELLKLEGVLEDKEAKVSLAKFLSTVATPSTFRPA